VSHILGIGESPPHDPPSLTGVADGWETVDDVPVSTINDVSVATIDDVPVSTINDVSVSTINDVSVATIDDVPVSTIDETLVVTLGFRHTPGLSGNSITLSGNTQMSPSLQYLNCSGGAKP
jgi:hypothetical protein